MSSIAVVTGAASGIGRECARQLLAGGWTVHALDRDAAGLATLSGERLHAVACDVSDAEALERAFATIASRSARIDALVCSAGVLRTGALMEMEIGDFDAVFAVNTRGAWLCAKHALALLRAAARPEAPARIVMLASAAAIRPKIGGGAYAASKAALARLVNVMAVELAREHILVNAIAPATVDTPMIAAASRASATTTYRPSGLSPLGRIASPADVVAVIRFLLEPASNYISGALIPVDGGTTAAFVPPEG